MQIQAAGGVTMGKQNSAVFAVAAMAMLASVLAVSAIIALEAIGGDTRSTSEEGMKADKSVHRAGLLAKDFPFPEDDFLAEYLHSPGPFPVEYDYNGNRIDTNRNEWISYPWWLLTDNPKINCTYECHSLKKEDKIPVGAWNNCLFWQKHHLTCPFKQYYGGDSTMVAKNYVESWQVQISVRNHNDCLRCHAPMLFESSEW